MIQQLEGDTFKRVLFALFDETFEQVQGIYLDKGTSLFETLDDITASEASRAISNKCATLAGQVEHVRFYLDVLEGYMLKTISQKVDWRLSWQTKVVTTTEWDALKERLRATYKRVLTTIHGFETWDEEQLGGALAIVVHTAHHLGEIRQMLCAIK